MRESIRKLAANRILWILAASVGAAFVFVLAESFTASHIAHAQVHVVPFMIRTENRLVSDNDAGTLVDVRTKARRSDGAVAEEGHIFGKVGLLAGENARKIMLPTGEIINAHDSAREVTSWNTGSSTAAAKRRSELQRFLLTPPLTGCVGKQEQSLGKETIMGQDTVEVIWPAGTRRVREWRAFNLGCEPLRALIEDRQADGSYKVHNEISTVLLNVGEPDAAFFDVPKDYREVKPSEFLHDAANRLAMPAGARPDFEKYVQEQDAEYAKNH